MSFKEYKSFEEIMVVLRKKSFWLEGWRNDMKNDNQQRYLNEPGYIDENIDGYMKGLGVESIDVEVLAEKCSDFVNDAFVKIATYMKAIDVPEDVYAKVQSSFIDQLDEGAMFLDYDSIV